jgi:hypothetical protein
MGHDKEEIAVAPRPNSPDTSSKEAELERHEVFKKVDEGVDFRTVGWPRAAVIFLKIIFALGVLSIPTSLYALGAVGGALSLVGWQALNTYLGVVQGNFRNRHPECHSAPLFLLQISSQY